MTIEEQIRFMEKKGRSPCVKDFRYGPIAFLRAVTDVIYTQNDNKVRTLLNKDTYVVLMAEARSRLNELENEYDQLQEKVERYEKAKSRRNAQRKKAP